MAKYHIECTPDETLLLFLGVTKRAIKHHRGKSRVFSALAKNGGNEYSMVDEDPGSAQTTYEKKLTHIEHLHNIVVKRDDKNNLIVILNGKLENWICAACKEIGISPSIEGLPNDPDELHSCIINRIGNYKKLLGRLEKGKSPSMLNLRKLFHL